MTIQTAPGETFEAKLEADEHGILWLHHTSRVTGKPIAFYGLATLLMIGWRIVDATPAERALLEAHGFGGGKVQ
jgi:hypothetical protein